GEYRPRIFRRLECEIECRRFDLQCKREQAKFEWSADQQVFVVNSSRDLRFLQHEVKVARIAGEQFDYLEYWRIRAYHAIRGNRFRDGGDMTFHGIQHVQADPTHWAVAS